MLENEENLVRRAAKGDPEAFGLLYDEYHPRIYRFIFLKVGARHDAEDLTHHVFANAWEHVGGYRPQGLPFGSWLYRIARNAVIDHYRTRKTQVSVEEVDPELFALSENIQADAQAALELAKVRRALARMKTEYQDVIIMRFVEELAIKEVATALKKSDGAVKLLQHRALRELKRLVHEEGGETMEEEKEGKTK